MVGLLLFISGAFIGAAINSAFSNNKKVPLFVCVQVFTYKIHIKGVQNIIPIIDTIQAETKEVAIAVFNANHEEYIKSNCERSELSCLEINLQAKQ